jgi:hypothetical protein
VVAVDQATAGARGRGSRVIVPVLFGLLCAALGVLMLWRAAATWRDGAPPRLLLPIGIWACCMALLFGAGAYWRAEAYGGRGGSMVGAVATLVSLGAVTLSSALLSCVHLFGRPRLLVPPRRRGVPTHPQVSTHGAGGPVIVIRRDRGGGRDLLRRYQIEVDGRHLGSIRRGGEWQTRLAPGPHLVQLRIDWCTSPVLRLELATGQRVVLRCRPAGGWVSAWTAMTVGRSHYIELLPADRD